MRLLRMLIKDLFFLQGLSEDAEAAYLEAKAMLPQARPGRRYTARVAPQHLSVFLNLANLIAK